MGPVHPRGSRLAAAAGSLSPGGLHRLAHDPRHRPHRRRRDLHPHLFTNTRSGAERLSHRLKLALLALADRIECHHSSLDRDLRQEVEDRLNMEEAAGMDWRHVEVPVVSPFAFGIYARMIKESMMMESPEEAIERLHRAMQEKLAQRTG